jgi:hypothetical protein
VRPENGLLMTAQLGVASFFPLAHDDEGAAG